jgi:phosphotransferase system enzyme I (PtsI)
MSKTNVEEVRFKGVPISPGVAVAKACLFNEARHNRLTPALIAEHEIEGEISRLHQAIAAAGARLAGIRERVAREVGPAEAEIFVAQQMMVDDRSLHAKMIAAMRTERAGAEMAVMSILDAYEARISALDNEYLRERASDIGEIKRRLLDELAQTRPGLRCEGADHCQRGRDRIVVAVELTPSLTVDLDTEHLRGFLTEHGGATSHATILARALGIPAVSGVADVHSLVACGTEVLLNGDTGEVVLWPRPETVALYQRRLAASAGPQEAVDPVPGLRVMANISVVSEAAMARRMKAEGIGLYRTEFEFMALGRVLTEDEQFQRYAALVKAMGGAPVYIRLLDLGGDKPAPYLGISAEANPALGLRGARLLARYGELLRTQARAIARASILGPIHVTYPMIVDVEQFVALRSVFMAALSGLEVGRLFHGVMLEVPAACLNADALLREADYGSIGTNDLYQYLFAIDRNNERVSADFRLDHPVFWDMLAGVVAAARRQGKPLSLCGEMAGWPEYVLRMRAIGITTVSVSARLVPIIRRTVATGA